MIDSLTPKSIENYSLTGTLLSIRGNSASAVQLIERAFCRIEQIESEVHAWVFLDKGAALKRAEELDRLPRDQRGPLHGLPLGVKDIIDVAGMPTKCGSTLRTDEPATSSAQVVTQLVELGAIPIGKTVTTEFAYFSPGPTRNPHNLLHTPGGSSSGSAAAVASGMVPLALGTQTAASVSRPASYCGTSALVTSKDVLPTGGITGLSESLDTVGLLGSDPEGIAEVYRLLATDAPSPFAFDRIIRWIPDSEFATNPAYSEILDSVFTTNFVGQAPNVAQGSLNRLVKKLISAHELIMAYESVRMRSVEAAQPESLSAQLNELFSTGSQISTELYVECLERVQKLKSELIEIVGERGVIIAPAAQSSAPQGLEATGSPIFSRPWQVLGLPVVIHSQFSDQKTGLPIGLQFIGMPGSDLALLKFSQSLLR